VSTPSKFLPRLSHVVAGLAVAISIAATVLGKRLNSNQMLGCLVVWAFLFVSSLAFFLSCSLPFRSLGVSDPSIRRSFRFSSLCLVYALFQIPIWSLMTRRFPPGELTETQAVIVTAGLVISLFGPATLGIILFFRQIRSHAKGQKPLSKERDRSES
jgi:hypothetical protein